MRWRDIGLLFGYFKNSTKELKKDYGLFNGARSGVFHKVHVQQLSTLLNEKLQGAIVLTHDASAPSWRELLDYQLVYGICEAKGLKFKTMILLNFFGEIPSSLQKPWREMLLTGGNTSQAVIYSHHEMHRTSLQIQFLWMWEMPPFVGSQPR